MKQKLSALSHRYAAALKKHVGRGSRVNVETARRLGCCAAAIGLETLDMARIHERALARLEAASGKDGFIERADLFFMETIGPIEETHRVALKAAARLNQLNKILSRRTVALAASNRSLKQGTAQRKAVEVVLKKTGEDYQTLLQESLALQKHLQLLTHRILLAHENKRKAISQELQDEIAQTLLGINVRLLTVRKAASQHATGLQKELAGTQRVVEQSKKTIERFAREYGKT
ncbi:MAG TPA: histidine kinase [Patescibacteria group bacterium]|nr:histidine kinase [Patescibacteria group bacterium]